MARERGSTHQLYMTGPLQDLKRRSGSRGFSRRLSTMVVRYQLCLDEAEPVPVTEQEKVLLRFLVGRFQANEQALVANALPDLVRSYAKRPAITATDAERWGALAVRLQQASTIAVLKLLEDISDA